MVSTSQTASPTVPARARKARAAGTALALAAAVTLGGIALSTTANAVEATGKTAIVTGSSPDEVKTNSAAALEACRQNHGSSIQRATYDGYEIHWDEEGQYYWTFWTCHDS